MLEPDESSEGTEQAGSGSRRLLIIVLGAVILVGAFFGGRMIAPLLRGDKAAPPQAVAEPARPEPTPPPPVAKTEPAAPEPAVPETTAPAKPRKKKDAPVPVAAPAPAAPTTGELRIDTDVPGAMVFLDRKFLGNAPVTARDVPPGRHQLNASADGYDGVSEAIDVVAGPAEITLRFKEIRLNATVDVVHKHGMGSCEGRLVADPKGVRYETSNKDDAFSMALTDIDGFEVDYLKKNLKLKRRGGKTYNFTTKAENADPLFVFHRDVDKVRKQVAGK